MKDYGTDFTTNTEVKTTFILLTAEVGQFRYCYLNFVRKYGMFLMKKRGVNSSESIAAAAEVMI